MAWGLPAVAAFTIFYMLLVDAEPPVVRATVLIVAACGAVYFGRRRVGFNILALAGLIVLALNPVDLFNVGPQLSFLCVAGLMAMAPSWMAMRLARTCSTRRSRRLNRVGGADLVRLAAGCRVDVAQAEAEPIETFDHERPGPFAGCGSRGESYDTRRLVSAAILALNPAAGDARFHIFNPIAVLINTPVWLPMAGALVSGLALLLCKMAPLPRLRLSLMFLTGISTRWFVYLLLQIYRRRISHRNTDSLCKY